MGTIQKPHQVFRKCRCTRTLVLCQVFALLLFITRHFSNFHFCAKHNHYLLSYTTGDRSWLKCPLLRETSSTSKRGSLSGTDLEKLGLHKGHKERNHSKPLASHQGLSGERGREVIKDDLLRDHQIWPCSQNSSPSRAEGTSWRLTEAPKLA